LKNIINIEKRHLKEAFNTRHEREGHVRTTTQLSYNKLADLLSAKGVE